jgi:ATP-dependent helicase YprA (DUF1998 family)
MNVFELRRRVIDDYGAYVRSFISLRDPRIRAKVEGELADGLLWPEPRIALNPAFAPGAWIDELVQQGLLHSECGRIFRVKPEKHDTGTPLRLHKHQLDAIRAASGGRNYVLTTGTGSGKSLSYIVPIVDHVLRSEKRKGIKAIVVYPMNALANSQYNELTKFLCHGYPDGKGPVTFRRYTGQEKDEERQEILADPPDILLTNYVMLELILTRVDERPLVGAAQDLRFLVLDELHTYRGRQGADVALLVRRTRDACAANRLQHVGTSATMATGGTFADQCRAVARVASALFGAEVKAEDVIGETLQRVTAEPPNDSSFQRALTDRVGDLGVDPPREYAAFVGDPLSRWIESAFGVTTEAETGRLVRAAPRPIRGIKGDARVKGAAVELAERTGVDEERCVSAIQEQLLAGYAIKQLETGFPVFAFRLHQFISRGDTVFASLESETTRHLTVHPQKFVPDDRDRLLFPLAFCRECGQEYYCVRIIDDGARLEPRAFDERATEGSGEIGYAYLNSEEPWSFSPDKLPEDWLEPGESGRVKYSFRDKIPRECRVNTKGERSEGGSLIHTIPAPFRFCLRCGMAYGGRARSDFSKLATLGTEGRSTATTILSLASVRQLRRDEALKPDARKLLSFTDNRQDASLQAGHFNDFVQVGLLRSALYKAALKAGPNGLSHQDLTQQVFDALALPFELYAYDATLRPYAREDTHKALRDVLGYRLYLDLRRGWRITSPNLEQTGLLRIEYHHLPEAAADEDLWKDCHPALAGAAPDTRASVARVLLDFMRKDLAVRVDYLDKAFQERLIQTSNQRLRTPWGIDENEALTFASTAVPRSERQGDWGGWLYLSPRGGFGYYLGRKSTFPRLGTPLRLHDRDVVIKDLLERLREAGLVQRVREPERDDDVAGYQVAASAMRWVADEGKVVLHDPIRVPRPPAEGGRPNAFFLDFYRTVAGDGQGLEAREHTAQVPYEAREEREQRFRKGQLPILYCSPTMELGVDIASLNVVNMRNVPPTPANYAQRSGRAGRSGQPALVVTYCSAGSPHDQYFFRRPQQMVSGQVTPPRLDLANEDLVRAHVHAIWLAETGMSLGRSLKDILDLSDETLKLDLLPAKRADVDRPEPRKAGKKRAHDVLATLRPELESSDWWGPTWLDGVFQTVGRSFEDGCGRWRSLFRAARTQFRLQNKIIEDHTRNEQDRNEARKLRREAEAQLALLTAEGPSVLQSDFYSYRYFASEGFLPGYSFPRLPLSAFIPGRKSVKGTDEFLSRPRFLAISEFGPRNFLYHEGSVYQINRVMLPVDVSDPAATRATITSSAKVCKSCGYAHPITDGVGPDRCEQCAELLGAPLTQLFRLQNVATRRRSQINSDEEERQRQGYELQSTVRFAESDGRPLRQTAMVDGPDGRLATLSYGHAAMIWRINRGWKRRRHEAEDGFVLDVERGYWAKDAKATDPDEPEDPMTPRRERVIPFVEDRKNALLLQPAKHEDATVMASLQAALKTAIQAEFQLEDGELAAEPLPDEDNRRYILLYESAEGGAGVLRRLVEDPGALAAVARRALDLCHFDPDSGADLGGPPWRPERCEAACYDCLMSYRNQTDHKLLDRKAVAEVLRPLAKAEVSHAPGALTRDEQFARLNRVAVSELERRWLKFLLDQGYRLPTDASKLFEKAGTRCDFYYADHNFVVYVDGPPHDFPERAQRDAEQQTAMEDLGYLVVRFRHDSDWVALIQKHPSVFGAGDPS